MQFTCPECGKTFQTKTGLSNHSRSHKRKLPETRSSAAIPKSVDSLAEGGQTHAELQNHVTRANVLAHDREPCNVTTKSKDESSQGMGSGGHMVVHPGYKELRTDDVVSVESRVISGKQMIRELHDRDLAIKNVYPFASNRFSNS